MRKMILLKRIVGITLVVVIMTALFTDIKSESVKADNNYNGSFDINNPPQNEIEKLYYGYNVTGGKDLMEPDALQTTFPIIDPDSDYKKYIKPFTGSEGNGISYYGHNHNEVVNNYITGQIFNAFGDIYMVNAEVSTKFKTEKKVNNAYTEWYEIYTKGINRHFYVVQLAPNEIKQFLSKRFKDDLYSIKNENDAKRLLETYGTHLNTGYQFGGRMIITNYMSSSQESKAYEESMEIGERLQLKYGVQIDENGSFSEEHLTQEITDFDSTSYSCVIYGGDANIPQRVEDLFTYNASLVSVDNAGYYYTKWENSINNDRNLVIIGIPNGAQSIPLWKLLDETKSESANIQQCLVNAYLKMCGDKYEEYEKKYPYLEKEVSKSDKETSVSIESAYIGTLNSYFYNVDIEDFDSSGSHYGIHNHNYIYLKMPINYGSQREQPEYEYQNCTPIDEKRGIFEVVKNTPDNFKIIVKSGDKKKTLIDIPILNDNFEGGMGNEEYPYIIVNKAQFKDIYKNRQAYYKLLSDIDFEGEALSSFGNFSGELDGNYCSLHDFTINDTENWGLFGINTGTIKNLKVYNAGTSLNTDGFSEGGVNYSEDYKNNKNNGNTKRFETNAICSKNAGLICAENKGTITNCSLSEIYIRNVIRNNYDYIQNFCADISVGIVSGTCSGKISQCLVKDCKILNAYLNDSGKSIDVGTYSGGIVGSLKGGEVDACIYDSGSKGTIMSLSVNEYENGNPTPSGNTINAYSAGISGLCIENSTVKRCYSYVRVISDEKAYQAIDADYIILDHFESKRVDNRHALRSASMICDVNVSLNSEDNYVYTADATKLEYACITPTTNGKIRNDKNFYKNLGYFSTKKINNKEDFNSMNYQNTCIRYADDTMSHFTQILETDRRNYIKIKEEVSEKGGMPDCYNGERYLPYNINIRIQFGDDSVEDLKIFRMYVKDNNGFNNLIPLNLKLYANNGENYNVEIYPYADDKIQLKKNIKIINNDLDYIRIKTDEKDKYTIYYDEIQDYFDSWNADKIDLYKVMTDGQELKIEQEDDKKAVSVNGNIDNISYGENLVEVSYITSRDVKKAKYILNVKKRDITSMEIIKAPFRTVYAVNSDEKINLQGIEVLLKYSEGEDKVVSTPEDIKKFEIIGSVSSIGDNTVYLSYGNYNNTVELVLQGEENKDMKQSTNEVTIIPEPTNILTPEPTEVAKPTEMLEPTTIPEPSPIPEPIPSPATSHVIPIVLSIFGVLACTVAIVFGTKYLKNKNDKLHKSTHIEEKDNELNDELIKDSVNYHEPEEKNSTDNVD